MSLAKEEADEDEFYLPGTAKINAKKHRPAPLYLRRGCGILLSATAARYGAYASTPQLPRTALPANIT